jgi:hypothetical protein
MVRVINGRKKVQRKEREQKGRRIKTKLPKNRERQKPLPVFLTNFLMFKKVRTVPEPVCRFSLAFHPAPPL